MRIAFESAIFCRVNSRHVPEGRSAIPSLSSVDTDLLRRSLCTAVCVLSLLISTTSATAGKPVVIWLSWDGVRHDYPSRAHFEGLSRLAREGAFAERLIPVFPTSTFPNHVALATCSPTNLHGIVENRFYDRKRGEYSYSNQADWIRTEPIWVAAERQGVKSASFFWVGSETNWEGVGASYRMAPFDDEISDAVKVDQILSWFDLPEGSRPGLIMSWWHGADGVGHWKGPEHPDIVKALLEQDHLLQRLLAGIDARGAWGETTLILSSDHGMTRLDRPIDPREALEDADISARVRSGAGMSNVYLEDPADLERAESILSGLSEGHEVHRAGPASERLGIGTGSRVGDLVLVARPPYYYKRTRGIEAVSESVLQFFGWRFGGHGFAADHPDMAGIFFAMGRGVPAGLQLGAVPNLDIAPTVSRWLGIEAPRDCVGRVIEGLGESKDE